MSHYLRIAARESLAMHLFTLHQVENVEVAVAMSSVHIAINSSNTWPSKLKTTWEGLTLYDRRSWRARADALIEEASA